MSNPYSASPDPYARGRYLYIKESWRHREDSAHDLRTSSRGVSVDMKRRYQWAETSFKNGYLSAAAFHAEALSFDEAVSEGRRAYAIHMRGDRCGSIHQEIRRLSRKSLRDGYTDRVAWAFVHERLRAQKESERQWVLAKEARRQMLQQWTALQTGRRTLADIRRLLRGQDRSPLPAFRPAKTSPTS